MLSVADARAAAASAQRFDGSGGGGVVAVSVARARAPRELSTRSRAHIRTGALVRAETHSLRIHLRSINSVLIIFATPSPRNKTTHTKCYEYCMQTVCVFCCVLVWFFGYWLPVAELGGYR